MKVNFLLFFYEKKKLQGKTFTTSYTKMIKIKRIKRGERELAIPESWIYDLIP